MKEAFAMKYFLIALFILAAPALCLAEPGNNSEGTRGVGYLAKADGTENESFAWVDLKDVKRIYFNCCGDNAHCSGIQEPLFKTAGFTECFTRAMTAALEKPMPKTDITATELELKKLELEKLKLQLEIEKVKLEQERIKAGVK
ncbi:MAG TPA: hypothetical protein PLI53_12315 [Geobacteraceae bacterium]|nr:hypothetical protein [Geobacteraceae bacterium]